MRNVLKLPEIINIFSIAKSHSSSINLTEQYPSALTFEHCVIPTQDNRLSGLA